MKKLITILIILILIITGLWWLGTREEKIENPVPPATPTMTKESAVESYVRANIMTLSPKAPALGGTWYVVSASVNPENNSGQVIYEDGHIQENRSFTYVLTPSGEVSSVTIQ